MNSQVYLRLFSDKPIIENLRGLSEEFRLAYGAGIVLMMGNIARLELNYVVPVRAQTGDRWEREKREREILIWKRENRQWRKKRWVTRSIDNENVKKKMNRKIVEEVMSDGTYFYHQKLIHVMIQKQLPVYVKK